jgi:hypothetical protein
MLILILAAAMASPSTTALAQCRPVLARKSGGQISSLVVDSKRRSGSTTILGGTLTALIGGPTPAPGYAGTHHLIRAQYHFRCWVRGRRVHRTELTQP